MATNWNDFELVNEPGAKKADAKSGGATDWGQFELVSPAGVSPPETDGPLTRGFKKAGQSMKMTAQLAGGDTEGVAQTAQEAADYAQANPGRPEGQKLMDAWEKGDGVTGGIGNVARQIKSDYDETKGFLPALKAVGRDFRAMGEGVVEQVPNMIAPTIGLVGGAAAGGAAAGPAGAIAGGWAGASAGNALIEGGDQIQTALQQAGINPRDTQAVQAYVDANRDQLLKQTAIKGGVIGAVDTATGGLAHYLLTAPGKAAAGRALSAMGVDMADKAAVKAATQSSEFAQQIAGDAAYQASKKGIGNIARNATAAALEPTGEFVGEYVGQGLANDQWDTKNAALEALSSIGQSGAMFAGQKAWQYATNPTQAANGSEADAGATPGRPADAGLTQEDPQQTGADAGLDGVRQNFAAQLDALRQQEQGDPAVPQSTPPDGRAVLDAQAAKAQADRDAAIAASRAVASPDDEILQSIGATAEPPHQAMGIDPNAGPLSAGAAIAVDSGAAGQMQAAAVQSGAEQEGNALATWDTLKPGDNVTLYRGESAANDANGQWWTTDRKKAERYGAVTEVTLPAEVAGRHAARGHNGADEFVFPNKRPAELAGEAGSPQAAMPVASQEQAAGSLTQAAQAENARPTAGPRGGGGKASSSGSGSASQAWANMSVGQRESLTRDLGLPPIFQKNVSRARWEGLNLSLQDRIAKAMAPAAPSVDGASLSSGWAKFSPESGTVGVPRAEMPQIKAEHRGAMVNFMNARGVAHREETLPASSLKPTQAEFSREKVERAKSFEGGNRAILVSADNHILDGHHQWMAARDKGDDVRAIRLNAPIRDLIGLAHEFPSSTRAADSAAVAEAERPQREADQKAQADAERGSFTLTGSDRPADVLAAQGQGGLFDAPEAAPEIAHHEMTQKEFLEHHAPEAKEKQIGWQVRSTRIKNGAGIGAMLPAAPSEVRDATGHPVRVTASEAKKLSHKAAVMAALSNKLLVPARVLADYPDLSQRFSQPAESPQPEIGSGGLPEKRTPAQQLSEALAIASKNQNILDGLHSMSNGIDSDEALIGVVLDAAKGLTDEYQRKARSAINRGTQKAKDGRVVRNIDRFIEEVGEVFHGLNYMLRDSLTQAAEAGANQEPIKNETRANAGPAAESTPADQEPVKNLADDFMLRPVEVMDHLIAAGEAKALYKEAGVKSADAFGGLSLEDQANAYAKYVQEGGKPAPAATESYNDRVARQEREARIRRLQEDRTVTQVNGKPFKTEASARAFSNDNELGDTHEAAARDGGFVLQKLPPARRPSAIARQEQRRATDPETQRQDAAFARAEKIGQAAEAAVTAYENGDASIEEFEAALDAADQPAVGNAPSPLEALFSDLNSESTRKAKKAKKAAAKLPQAARIDYVQANFHDILMQMMDAGALEVNGAATLTEDNKSCL